MIRICSLDFLNKDRFEVDVMTADGSIVASSKEKITPEKLLRLYFKEIYVQKSSAHVAEDVPSELPEEQLEEHLELQLQTIAQDSLQESVAEDVQEELQEEDGDELLEFDEAQAQRVSKDCVAIAVALDFSEERKQELEKAAYYYNIGRTRLKKEDLRSKDYKKKQADAGYDICLSELKLSISVAEAVRFWSRGYSIKEFNLKDEIPYAHIISIVNYYDNLLQNLKLKEDIFGEMLMLGSNKFNPFVLHKFLRLKREENAE